MTRHRTVLFAASASLGVFALSACGGHGRVGGQPPARQQALAVGTKADAVRLTATNVGQLGPVVTDGAGLTLYRFDRDTNMPSASNCVGACATTWPPLLAFSDEVRLKGIDKAVVGTVTRQDGTRQVTISGWPVYHYAKDTTPGQAGGQGLQGTWFAVTPQGKKATGAADSGDVGDTGSGY
jgi:predicted lipoprotein with Yx(FWY)xxD motif